MKKIGKRYKNQSEKLQQLLNENNISHQHITNQTSAPNDSDASSQQAPSSTTQPMDAEEKKQLQDQINEKIKTIDKITTTLSTLEAALEAEKQGKVESQIQSRAIQQQYSEAENKIVDLMNMNQQLTSQLTEEKVDNYFATYHFSHSICIIGIFCWINLCDMHAYIETRQK